MTKKLERSSMRLVIACGHGDVHKRDTANALPKGSNAFIKDSPTK